MGVRKPPIPITTLPCRLFFLWKKGRTYLSAVTKKESRSHCTSSVGGRWAVKFPDNTAPIISKMEDISMLKLEKRITLHTFDVEYIDQREPKPTIT